jgi:hypothetical protein
MCGFCSVGQQLERGRRRKSSSLCAVVISSISGPHELSADIPYETVLCSHSFRLVQFSLMCLNKARTKKEGFHWLRTV